MPDYDVPLDEYEENAPTVARLPGEREPVEVLASDARPIAMPLLPPNPLIGKTVQVATKGRYDYGVTGTITDTKPGDLWVRVWTESGMAVWYSIDDLTVLPGGSPPTSGAVAG